MSDAPVLLPLDVLAARIGNALRERGETVAVAESASGGLVSAALLAVPGASAFFLGGAVVYTRHARQALLGLTDEDFVGISPQTERYAELMARTVRTSHDATWGLGETGAAGPTGSRYGYAPGHACLAVVAADSVTRTIETAHDDRVSNMNVFARQLLSLFSERLQIED